MDAHYDAAIWDMDGLLLDSEQISASCWLEASRLVGLSVEPDFFHAVIGMNRGGIEAFLANAVEPDVSTARLIDEATALYIAAIEAGVPLKPGARSCLDWLRDHAIPQGLATSSGHPFATKKLGHHGLVERFGAFVTGDRVSRGKPEPDIFLTASEELQVAPDR